MKEVTKAYIILHANLATLQTVRNQKISTAFYHLRVQVWITHFFASGNFVTKLSNLKSISNSFVSVLSTFFLSLFSACHVCMFRFFSSLQSCKNFFPYKIKGVKNMQELKKKFGRNCHYKTAASKLQNHLLFKEKILQNCLILKRFLNIVVNLFNIT